MSWDRTSSRSTPCWATVPGQRRPASAASRRCRKHVSPSGPGEVNQRSSEDKAANKATEVKGEVKEGLGQVTDNEELEAEGKTDQAKGDLKQASEKVKDAFKK